METRWSDVAFSRQVPFIKRGRMNFLETVCPMHAIFPRDELDSVISRQKRSPCRLQLSSASRGL